MDDETAKELLSIRNKTDHLVIGSENDLLKQN
jgi:hypothetical protein